MYISCLGCGELIDPSEVYSEDIYCRKCYACAKKNIRNRDLRTLESKERNDKFEAGGYHGRL